MASGKPVLSTKEGPLPPGSSAATPVVLTGAATPAEKVVAWAFDASTAEYVDFKCVLDGYASGGLTVKLKWSSTATSNACVWRAAIRRIQDDAEDYDTTAHDYSTLFNSVTATTASAAGEVDYASITFTDGADMDSLADGELFILRIGRDATNGSDTLTTDAYLWDVGVYET